MWIFDAFLYSIHILLNSKIFCSSNRFSRPRVDTIGIRDGYCRSYADSSSYCHALEQPFERIVKRILKGFACKQACGRTSCNMGIIDNFGWRQ